MKTTITHFCDFVFRYQRSWNLANVSKNPQSYKL